jgi:hypothetical protein
LPVAEAGVPDLAAFEGLLADAGRIPITPGALPTVHTAGWQESAGLLLREAGAAGAAFDGSSYIV